MSRYYEFDARLSALVKNGRAVLYPVYKGTFERGDESLSNISADSYLFAEYVVKLVKDFKRCIDYLETRRDIDSRKLAYFGFSWGGHLAIPILAVEDRIRAGVLVLGGGMGGSYRPEISNINYVTRVKIPILMLNGKYDLSFPFETIVKPLFDLLGTPRQHKDIKVYENDHFIPLNECIKETLNWLEKHLGPVR